MTVRSMENKPSDTANRHHDRPLALIVEDNSDARHMMCDILSSEEVDILEAIDGSIAVEMIEKHNPDVVITDQRMPGMTGLEMLRELRRRKNEVEVIMVTAFEERDLIVECIKNRASGFLRKPFNIKEFRSTIMTAVRRANLEKENRKLNRQLRLNDRLAALGRAVAAITHEIRSPLTYVQGSMQVIDRLTKGILAELPDNGTRIGNIPINDAKSMLEDSLRDAKRGCSIIEDIIKTYRGYLNPSQKIEEIAVADIIKEATLLCQYADTNNVTLETKIDASSPTIHGKRMELVQVLVNLISNACHATLKNNGTTPRIEISTSTIVSPTGKTVNIIVEDNGPGVPEEKRQSIFEEFVSDKENGMGMGLGVSRKIARDHGGDITVDKSRLGGALFTFSISPGGK